MRPFTVLIICCLFSITLPAQKKEYEPLSPQEVTDLYAYYEANKDRDLNYTQKIPPYQLQADLKILKLILEEAHTNIYNYGTQEEVNDAFLQAISSCKDSLTYLEFVRKVSEIQYVIACGHSAWSHPKAFRRYRERNIGLFPLDLNIINGRYYIRRNYTGAPIPNGSYITHVNGMPVDSISRRMRRYMTRDGNSNVANELELSEMFRNAYSNFIGNPDEFHIIYHDGSYKSTRELILLPITRPRLDTIAKEKGFDEELMGTPLSLTIDNKRSTAVYTIKWFNNEYIASQGQEFISFTDSVFQQLANKRIQNLVIDLRGNVGGWTANGRHLLSYFIDEQHPYIKSVRTKKYKDFSFTPLITDMPGYNDTMELVLKDGLYEWQNNPNLIAYPATANRFRGKVFILTDGHTRSAASIFCALMKEHTNAIFIGEETGASRSIQGGMVMTVQLPYSRLLVNFSTARYDLAVSDHSTTGIFPDHKIERAHSLTEEQCMLQVKKIIERSR